jgi:probable F420-dependent oxidoreductase
MKFFLMLTLLDADHHTEVALAAEDAGYFGVALGDHILFPESLYSTYPYGEPPWTPEATWPDIWVTFAALGAVTTKLRFMSNIFIAPLHPPVTIANQIATAARLTGDRIWLGVGAGWMKEEFDAVGQEYDNRGGRLDEQTTILRELWRGEMVEHHGRYYDLPRMQISPVPAAPVPILTGGETDVALRRAARQDGWAGANYEVDEAIHHVERLDRFRAEAGTDGREDYEVVLGLPERLPTVDECRRLEEAGVTAMIVPPFGVRWRPELTRGEIVGRVGEFADQVIAKLD